MPTIVIGVDLPPSSRLSMDYPRGQRAKVGARATHDPPKITLHAARQHDAVMVVVGTHGRRGLHRLIMGSVAEAVVREADRPVPVPSG